MWKSLELAKDELAQYAVKYPRARQRILVLTDGEDTVSDSIWWLRSSVSAYAQGVCEAIQVVPDCYKYQRYRGRTSLSTVCSLVDLWTISLGEFHMRKLHYMLFIVDQGRTGGYSFSPKTVNDMTSICQLESVVCLEERVQRTPQPLASSMTMYAYRLICIVR